MALGDFVAPTNVSSNLQATATFTCPVDNRINVVGPGTVAVGTSYVAQICPGCGTHYLLQVSVPALVVTIQRTS